MSLVVVVERRSLAIGAEVQVIADSTLVSIAEDVVQVGLAKRSITSNAGMHGLAAELRSNVDRLEDWNELVAWMGLAGGLDADRAVVPIWTAQALMADSNDGRLASIADSIVASSAAGVQQSGADGIERRLLSDRSEPVHGVMSVLLGNMAWEADIEVLADGASHEALLRQRSDAAVAGACSKPSWSRISLWRRIR